MTPNKEELANFAKLKFACPTCSFNIILEIKGSKQVVEQAIGDKAIPLRVFGEANRKKNFYLTKLAEMKGVESKELAKILKPEFEEYVKQIDLKKAKRQQEKLTNINVSTEADFLADLLP